MKEKISETIEEMEEKIHERKSLGGERKNTSLLMICHENSTKKKEKKTPENQNILVNVKSWAV